MSNNITENAFYSKQDVFNKILYSLQCLPSVLIDLICDYSYILEYALYHCFVPEYDNHSGIYTSYCYEDYLIELVDDICYVKEIVTNKVINKQIIDQLSKQIAKEKTSKKYSHWEVSIPNFSFTKSQLRNYEINCKQLLGDTIFYVSFVNGDCTINEISGHDFYKANFHRYGNDSDNKSDNNSDNNSDNDSDSNSENKSETSDIGIEGSEDENKENIYDYYGHLKYDIYMEIQRDLYRTLLKSIRFDFTNKNETNYPDSTNNITNDFYLERIFHEENRCLDIIFYIRYKNDEGQYFFHYYVMNYDLQKKEVAHYYKLDCDSCGEIQIYFNQNYLNIAKVKRIIIDNHAKQQIHQYCVLKKRPV